VIVSQEENLGTHSLSINVFCLFPTAMRRLTEDVQPSSISNPLSNSILRDYNRLKGHYKSYFQSQNGMARSAAYKRCSLPAIYLSLYHAYPIYFKALLMTTSSCANTLIFSHGVWLWLGRVILKTFFYGCICVRRIWPFRENLSELEKYRHPNK